jgi:hypothetical protein
VNALADEKVGKYLNEYFVSSFQKVATFKIVGNGQKQGGNVASYFCAPDGRVLHVIAGPVDAATLLKEANWVVETTKKAMDASKGDGATFKAYFRKAHAERLRQDYGLVVEPLTFDPPVAQDESSALTYRDPSGRPLAPVLPPAPIDGPDVTFREAQLRAAAAPGAGLVADRKGRRWSLNNQGRAHVLMAAHSMTKIEKIYGSVFEGILGEKISTKPVEIVNPFPWVRTASAK